jgi:hypothetical protein
LFHKTNGKTKALKLLWINNLLMQTQYKKTVNYNNKKTVEGKVREIS